MRSRFTEHSKIIEERNFIKNGVNRAIFIFGIFSAFRMLEKIALDIKTRRVS